MNYNQSHQLSTHLKTKTKQKKKRQRSFPAKKFKRRGKMAPVQKEPSVCSHFSVCRLLGYSRAGAGNTVIVTRRISAGPLCLLEDAMWVKRGKWKLLHPVCPHHSFLPPWWTVLMILECQFFLQAFRDKKDKGFWLCLLLLRSFNIYISLFPPYSRVLKFIRGSVWLKVIHCNSVMIELGQNYFLWQA